MHTLALSIEGKVWSWGCNDDAVLGRSGAENVPMLIPGLAAHYIVDVACGDSHSGAVTKDGDVFTWGTYKGSGGHLGYNADTKKQKVRAC